MTRKPKYTIEDIQTVHKGMNEKGLSKREAIKKAGFSDSSVYYHAVKRLNVLEKIVLEQKFEEQC